MVCMLWLGVLHLVYSWVHNKLLVYFATPPHAGVSYLFAVSIFHHTMALLTQLSASQVRQAVCSIARVAASAGATSAHAGAADNSYSCRYMSTPAPLSSYSLPADLQPRLYNGKHYQPRISARQAADLRKKLILAAMNGVDVGLRWDPSWERANKSVITRLPKGTRHDLKIKDRYVRHRVVA